MNSDTVVIGRVGDLIIGDHLGKPTSSLLAFQYHGGQLSGYTCELGRCFAGLNRGLSQPIRVVWLGPFLRAPSVRQGCRWLTHPVPAWCLFVAATWFWHVPRVYELALRSDGWHYLQHACFLGTGLLFWYPVLRPYPSRPTWSPWLLVPYLMAAVRMYEDGFASREDIDQGMKLGAGHPMGPLELCDFIGLDVLYSVCDSLYEEFKRPEYAPPPLMKRMVASVRLGRKSGRGFYDYEPAKVPA